MTSSNGKIFRVTDPLCGEFTGHRWIPPAQRPVTRSFATFFDLRLNKLLSKQSWGCWFETLWRPLWRHCNVCTITLTGLSMEIFLDQAQYVTDLTEGAGIRLVVHGRSSFPFPEVFGINVSPGKLTALSVLRVGVIQDGSVNTFRADSIFAPSQWETALLCNDVSYWLGASLESALHVEARTKYHGWYLPDESHFQMYFPEWKLRHFDSNFTDFYPRPVLAFGYCRCLRVCVCVRVSVRQSSACPYNNSSTVQARITKFGPEMEKTLVKIPIILWDDWPWTSRSNRT